MSDLHDGNGPNDPNNPLNDPMFAAPDPSAYDLRGGSKSKLPLVIVGLLVAGGIGYFVFHSMQTRNERKEHVAFMQSFQDLESDDVGAFWTCLLGPKTNISMFPDNLALQAKVDASFFQDPTGYPDKVVNSCVPKLRGVAAKAAALSGPSDYSAAVAAYSKTLDPLGDGIKEWAQSAKERIPEREAENAVDKDGTAFHSVAGKAPPEAIAYARFMRCAVPDVDKLKDEQALLEKLFNSCKQPDFVAHIRNDCAKVAQQVDPLLVREDKPFKGELQKFGGDDRDVAAFSDCFKKGRKNAKRDDFATFGKAFVEYMKASSEIRKIGAEKLKTE